MRKVAILARVSTRDKQDYERQVSDLKRVILKHGYAEEDIDTYKEVISGYSKVDDRIQFKALMDKIIENPKYYEAIYTTEVSRIGRNTNETRQIIDNLTNFGVPIYLEGMGLWTLNQKGEKALATNIILQLLIELADYEAEQLKQRSRSGLRYSASIGRAGGSNNHPYGYMKDSNKMLVINPEEEDIVKMIYRHYSQNNGVKTISNVLNEMQVPTRTNKTHKDKIIKFKIPKDGSKVKWSDKTVLDIIDNPIYYGSKRFKGERFEVPAIITKELWDECQEIKSGKTHRNYLTTYTYLLKDMITCGCCKRNYFARYKPTPSGDKVYICSSRLGKGNGCGQTGVNISLLESAIYDQMIKSETLAKYVNKEKEIIESLSNEIDNLNSSLRIDKLALEQKENEMRRLIHAYSLGNLTPEMLDGMVGEAENQIKLINDKIKRAEDVKRDKQRAVHKYAKPSHSSVKMFHDAMDNREELRAMFQQFIERVTITTLNDSFIVAALTIKINGIVMPTPLLLLLDKKSVRTGLRYLVLPEITNYHHPEFAGQVLEFTELNPWTLIENQLLVEPISKLISMSA